MTGKERILATVRGERPDHRAFMPISMSRAAVEASDMGTAVIAPENQPGAACPVQPV